MCVLMCVVTLRRVYAFCVIVSSFCLILFGGLSDCDVSFTVCICLLRNRRKQLKIAFRVIGLIRGLIGVGVRVLLF